MRPIQAVKAAPCLSGALLLGLSIANPAFAQGFSLSGFVSESLDFTENAGLSAVSPGATLTSSTSLGLSLLTETPVSSFGIDASTYLYIARNPDGSLNREFGYPSLALNYSDTTASRAFTFAATYRISPAGNGSTFLVDDENDDGIIDPGEVTILLTDARQISYGLTAGYSTDLTARDTIRVTARASWVDFDGFDPDLIASQRQSLRVAWSHQLADDLSGGLNLSGRWFENEALVPTVSTTTSLTANLNYAANSVLSLGADLGISKVDVQEGATISSTNSLTGSASMDYELADGSIGVDLKFGVEPSDGGLLRQSVSLGANYSQAINNNASISVAVDWSADGDVGEAFGSGSRSVSFSPTYRHQLTDDISANAGYRFESVSGSPGAASHGVFFGLTKNFQFLK